MSRRAPFVLGATALEPGTTLIEASAGTGKTFTIAGLVLRLILEHELSIREILVVTYTEAATEELRHRVRQALVGAVHLLRHEPSDYPGLTELLAGHLDRAAELLPRLERALIGFDEAPIFTMHGFCQRALKDRAFESGTLFDLELLPDEGPLMQEVADDEWRRRFYRADPVVVACALHLKVNPDRLLNWLKFCHRQPGLRILSPVAGRSWPALAADLARAFHQAAALWQKEAKEIRALLTSPGWAKGHHAKPDEQDEMLRA